MNNYARGSNAKKPPNQIEIVGDYIKIFDIHGNICLIDKEDYDKVREYRWCRDGYGYWMLKTFGPMVKIHRIICDVTDKNIIVDHINRDISDNRKNNLRIVNKKENAYNHAISKNNSTGFVGIEKRILKSGDIRWIAKINVNYKTKHIGSYCTLREAVEARLRAELELFGRYAPQRHLFAEYGIGDANE